MKYGTLILFIFISFKLLSQTINLTGIIYDSQTGEQVPFGHVIDKTTNRGVVSNNYGYFSIKVTKGIASKLVIKHVSFQTKDINLIAYKDTFIRIEIEPGVQLSEVLVESNHRNRNHKLAPVGKIEIPVKNFELIPVIFGEADLLKNLQMLPGIQGGQEGTSNIHIRGGSPDQNLILLDGIHLYNPNHVFGFFSVFNNDALKNVEVYKGGFPAKYGGKISSVLDIMMKDGNNKEFKGSGSIGIVSAGFSVEGPIKKNQSSFIFTGRRSYIDLLAKPFIEDFADGANVGYNFYDFTGKLNFNLSKNNHLFFSIYNGHDLYETDREEGAYDDENYNYFKEAIVWSNLAGNIRWNHIYSGKLFGNLLLAYTSYNYKSKDEQIEKDIYKTEKNNLGLSTKISDLVLKKEFSFYFKDNYQISFGFGGIYHHLTPEVEILNYSSNRPPSLNIDTVYSKLESNSLESYVYVENQIQFNEKVNANIGFRGVFYFINNFSHFAFEPRMALNLELTENIVLKTGYAKTTQYMQLLSSSNLGLPSDIWINSNSSILPAVAHQLDLSVSIAVVDDYFFSIGGYYKKMNNLVEYKEGASYFNNNHELAGFDDIIVQGKGDSYGIELFIEKSKDDITGWLSYTYGNSKRKFEQLNNGEPFPYKYDRRHSLDITSCYKINSSVDLSAAWVFSTGYPYFLSQGAAAFNVVPDLIHLFSYGTQTNFGLLYANRNAFRMPNYHRLDLSVRFKKQKKNFFRIWNIGLYNA